MTAGVDAGPDPVAVLNALLRGQAAAAGAVANTLRADAFGHSTFGRTDTLDLFSTHPLALSAQPHVLLSQRALAVLDETDDGRCIGIYADLADGVIARLWVVAATAADARCEAAVPVARDDFLSQLRLPCQGDAADHPGLDAAAWPHVLSLGTGALAAAAAVGLAAGSSSSQAIVMRTFGIGTGGQVAALYGLRVHEHAVPRRAHRRLALATARRDAAGTVVSSRLALSDPLPEPEPVFFSAR